MKSLFLSFLIFVQFFGNSFAGPLDAEGLTFNPCKNLPSDLCWYTSLSGSTIPSQLIPEPGTNWSIKKSTADSNENQGSAISELVESSKTAFTGSACSDMLGTKRLKVQHPVKRDDTGRISIRFNAKLNGPGAFGVEFNRGSDQTFIRNSYFTTGCVSEGGTADQFYTSIYRYEGNFFPRTSNNGNFNFDNKYFEPNQWYQVQFDIFTTSESAQSIAKWDPLVEFKVNGVNQARTGRVSFPGNAAINAMLGQNIYIFCAGTSECVFDDIVVFQPNMLDHLTGPMNCYFCNTVLPQRLIWNVGDEPWCRCCREGCGTSSYGYTPSKCASMCTGSPAVCGTQRDSARGFKQFCDASGVRPFPAYTSPPTPQPTPPSGTGSTTVSFSRDCEACAVGFGASGSLMWCKCCQQDCGGLKGNCETEGFCDDKCTSFPGICAVPAPTSTTNMGVTNDETTSTKQCFLGEKGCLCAEGLCLEDMNLKCDTTLDVCVDDDSVAPEPSIVSMASKHTQLSFVSLLSLIGFYLI